MEFFSRTLVALMKTNVLARNQTVLVVCGGEYDASVLREAGFSNVTISNLDERYDESCRPYDWSKQDAEALTFGDGSFDWVAVHAGLHHCTSPHRALLEMCRVARKGVLVLEARDSMLIRVGVKLGFTGDYEIEAVAHNDFVAGGVRNSAVPNFIYRWTEREVRKVIESAYPQRENDIRFFYGLRLPLDRLLMGSRYRRALAAALGVVAIPLQRLFPRQCNQFGFAILHTDSRKPWISEDGNRLRRESALSLDMGRYDRRA